jgi:hypothetical protein
MALVVNKAAVAVQRLTTAYPRLQSLRWPRQMQHRVTGQVEQTLRPVQRQQQLLPVLSPHAKIVRLPLHHFGDEMMLVT